MGLKGSKGSEGLLRGGKKEGEKRMRAGLDEIKDEKEGEGEEMSLSIEKKKKKKVGIFIYFFEKRRRTKEKLRKRTHQCNENG